MKYFISERICLPLARVSFGLVLISTTVFLAAVIPKAVIVVVGRTAAREEQLFNGMIKYSLLLGAIGMAGCISTTAITTVYDAFTGIDTFNNDPEFDYDEEIEKHRLRLRKEVCVSCKYYSGNNWLPCAVHPELKLNCRDYYPID